MTATKRPETQGASPSAGTALSALATSATAGSTARPLPTLWVRLSVARGNLLQLGGMALGSTLLVAATRIPATSSARVALMVTGWLAIYLCCHAVAHYAIGRLVGIRFRGYGIRGTDHPENYPPVVRQIMSILPFFTALTERESMRRAPPLAQAAMFAAGETSTTVCSLLAALYAWKAGIPGGQVLFFVTLAWNLSATLVTALVPRGDYTKARRALRPGS